MAGIFAQTVVFGATITGAGAGRGHPEGHHRPVPVAADVTVGRAGRPHRLRRRQQHPGADRDEPDRPAGGLADPYVGRRGAARVTLLLLVFAYAISWIMAWIGMLVPSPEVVNNASFIVIFPLTFIANTFVPLRPCPARCAPSPSGTRSRRSRRRRGSCSATSTRSGPRSADVVGAAEPGALHADLVGRDPGAVHPAGQLAVPPLDQPLSAPRRRATRAPRPHRRSRRP